MLIPLMLSRHVSPRRLVHITVNMGSELIRIDFHTSANTIRALAVDHSIPRTLKLVD